MRRKQNQLWQDSPCSYNYIMTSTALDLLPRFKVGSIYYRDEVSKAKRIFNEFQKPQILVESFRKQILEAGHPKYNSAGKKQMEREKNLIRRGSLTDSVSLYEVPKKIGYEYDRHGWRTHQTGEYNVKQIESSVITSRRNFSYGRRMDFSRPLNFFPGPGTYNPEQSLELSADKLSKIRTCIQLNKKRVQSPTSNSQQLRSNSNISRI